MVLDCKGVTFFTGVGKSGFIAQKISMTLVSTGTKSVFLNPTDALHGDIGIVGQNDVIVMFSKSGATEELLKLTPYARAKGAKIVGVSSVPGCVFAWTCDVCVMSVQIIDMPTHGHTCARRASQPPTRPSAKDAIG